MWLVSLESLPVPATKAVARALQARLGLAAVPDNDPGSCSPAIAPLALLLRRLRAIARIKQDVLLPGSWVLATPADPALRALHHDLGTALARKLLPADAHPVTHLLLCLSSSADEAFEASLDAEHARDVTLQALRQSQRAIEDAARLRAAVSSPFEARIVMVPCPVFAADNPVELKRVVELACDTCHALMHP